MTAQSHDWVVTIETDMPKQTFLNLPDDKRERFITAAIDEFADNDYANASISRLCKQVGIAKGSFYQYFEDKKELFLYLIDLSMIEKKALLANIKLPDPDAGLFDTLRWMFKLQAQFDLQHPRLAEVGYRAIYRELPFKDEMLEGLRQQGKQGYRQLIERGIADGSVRSDIDLDVATFMLSTVFGELGRYLPTALGIDDRQMITRELSDAQWARANELFEQFIVILERGMGQS